MTTTVRSLGPHEARPSWGRLGLFALALLAGALVWPSLPRADTIRIVAIGDSNLDPPGVRAEDMYPPKLAAALRAKGDDVVVTNAGHRGDLTRDVLGRLARDVPAGTDIALVAVGVNDFAARVDGPTISKNLEEIVRRLRERKIEVLLFGIGSLQNPECCRGAKLAKKYHALFYRNFQDGVNDDPALHVETERPSPGIAILGQKAATAWHLNAAGYDAVVARTLPLVEQLIERVKARK